MADAMVKANAFIEAAGVEPEEAPTIAERPFRPRPMPVACAEKAMRASNTVFITSRENIHRVRDIRHRTIIPTCRNGFTPRGRSSGAQMGGLALAVSVTDHRATGRTRKHDAYAMTMRTALDLDHTPVCDPDPRAMDTHATGLVQGAAHTTAVMPANRIVAAPVAPAAPMAMTGTTPMGMTAIAEPDAKSGSAADGAANLEVNRLCRYGNYRENAEAYHCRYCDLSDFAKHFHLSRVGLWDSHSPKRRPENVRPVLNPARTCHSSRVHVGFSRIDASTG